MIDKFHGIEIVKITRGMNGAFNNRFFHVFMEFIARMILVDHRLNDLKTFFLNGGRVFNIGHTYSSFNKLQKQNKLLTKRKLKPSLSYKA